MAITAETMFRDFKNKEEIKSAPRSVSLCPTTVTRRVESLSEDVDRQVLRDLTDCEYFSLQFGESQDIMDTARLVIFVRMTSPEVMITSQTASDWLSVAMSQTSNHSQTASSHSRHTDSSLNANVDLMMLQ
ncbi:General transcription factor II-I repeat domain-containing protein 2A [Xyrichtys novacula]|uniref:General transcription factor II-I repeat domain-containing protein 2A n=1 Tax=Xyrichtys novacula TaxID=13765 RepID=A0AAV1EMW1_XYRNO|nr:General transcription factor II-I repeat domain-containing protein 2A [Xyrichtys novacula]